MSLGTGMNRGARSVFAEKGKVPESNAKSTFAMQHGQRSLESTVLQAPGHSQSPDISCEACSTKVVG